MKNSSSFCRAAIFVAVFFACFAGLSAQQPIGPGYEVVVQLIVGSDDVQKSEVPAELAAAAARYKAAFPGVKYRLAATFIGRVVDGGSLSNKGVANFLTKGGDPAAPTFIEWSLGNFTGADGPGGAYAAQSFRFDARVPLVLNTTQAGPVVYEPVGLNVSRISLRPNAPTVVGTLGIQPNDAATLVIVTVTRSEL